MSNLQLPCDADEGASVRHPRRAARLQGEALRLLHVMDRTPLSDWASLSGLLTQLLRCVEGGAGVVSSPRLFCRVMWKCFDPKGAMGVHRKALEVLRCLCHRAGTFSLLQQLPLLLACVLDLLPQCSMQFKCELLRFLQDRMSLGIGAEVVAVELPGLLVGLLGGLEEKETSEVYRMSLKIMGLIHSSLNSPFVVTHKAVETDAENGNFYNADCTLSTVPLKWDGDTIVYRALWYTLKNSPSLRRPVLLYLKLRVCGTESYADDNDDNDDGRTSYELGLSSSLPRRKSKNFSLSVSIAPYTFVGGNPRIAYNAIFVTLQEQNERRLRLMLDILISVFPLEDEAMFTFSERFLLVAATAQLLGAPNVTCSIRRRIAEWLTGPIQTNICMYVENVSSPLLVNAFYGVVLWWELRFGILVIGTKSAPVKVSELTPLELSSYEALFTSAMRSFRKSDEAKIFEKAQMRFLDVGIMLVVWLRVFINLFQLVFEQDAADRGELGGDPCALRFHGADNDNGNGDDNDSGNGDFMVGGNPFMRHVAPLVVPIVCDMLVSFRLSGKESSSHSRIITSTLSSFVAVVPWTYFTRYERDMIVLLEKYVELLRKPVFSNVNDVALQDCSLSALWLSGDSEKLLLNLQTCFQRLGCFAAVLASHVVDLADRNLEQSCHFFHDVSETCMLLCSIMCGACEAMLLHDTYSTNGLHSAVARALIDGCLETFSVIFFGMATALKASIGSKGKYDLKTDCEVILLEYIMRSSTILSRFVLRNYSFWGNTFERINDSIFSFICYSVRSDGGSSIDDCNKFDIRSEILEKWVDSVATVACSSFSALQQNAFRLHTNLIHIVALPPSIYDTIIKQRVTARLLPRLWEFFGTCDSPLVQTQVARLLLKMYSIPEGRVILDGITTEATLKNGERMVLFFSLLEEKEIPPNCFLPGLLMMLRALDGKNTPLRWLARSMVHQLLTCLYRVLDPLFEQLERYLLSCTSNEESAKMECMNVVFLSKCDNSSQGLGPEMVDLSLRDFVLLIKSILSIPSLLQQVILRLCQMNAPKNTKTLILLFLQGFSKSEKCEKKETYDPPLDSAFAALSCVFLHIARQGILPQLQNIDVDTSVCTAELCVEACEPLNILLEGSLSLSSPPCTILHVWKYSLSYIIDLLRDVAGRHPLVVEAHVLMLRHILYAVRFLLERNSSLSSAFFADQSFLTVEVTQQKSNDNSSFVEAVKNRESSAPDGSFALMHLGKFFETVSVCIEAVVNAGLMSSGCGKADVILSVWCDTLLELLPIFREDLQGVSKCFLSVFIKVIDDLLKQMNFFTEFYVFCVIGKCLNVIYGILEYHTVMARQPRQDRRDARRSVGASLMVRVLTLGVFNFLPTADTGCPDLIYMEVVQQFMRPVVTVLCRLYFCMRQIVQRHADEVEGGANGSTTISTTGAFSHVESVITRLLQLYREMAGADLCTIIIDLWAAEYGQSFTEFIATQSAFLPFTPLARCSYPEGVTGNDGRSRSSILLDCGRASESLVLLSDQTLLPQLLGAGAGVSALMLIRIAQELLAKHRSLFPSSSSSSSLQSCHVIVQAKMPIDATVFYFLYAFFSTCCLPPNDILQLFGTFLDVVLAHLSHGTPSLLSLPFILHIFLLFGPSGALSLQSLGRVDGESFTEWGKDKRCSLFICRVLDAFSAATVDIAAKQDELQYAYSRLSLVLRSFSGCTLLDQDRIAVAALSFYRRSVFSTITFATEAHAESDVSICAQLAKAALTAAHVLLELGDYVLRRLRQEFRDILFDCEKYCFLKGVTHEWGLVIGKFAHDRAFHGDVMQFCVSSSSPPSRIAALVQSLEEEERQRNRQRKALILYTLSMPNSLLIAGRGFLLLLRERMDDAFRTLDSFNLVSTKHKVASGFRNLRYAIFLFRVLLAKLDSALLYPFWPLVLPGVIQILSFSSGELDGDVAAEGELLALQTECLKLLDFLIVLIPEAFAPYRWLFFDDLDLGVTLPRCAMEVSTPVVRSSLIGSELDHSLQPPFDVRAGVSSVITGRLGGYHRPLLRISSDFCNNLATVQACAGALFAFSQTIGVLPAEEDDKQSLVSVTRMRLMDDWDEEYVRLLLEEDLLCIIKEGPLFV